MSDSSNLIRVLFNQIGLMYSAIMVSSSQATPAFLHLADHPLRWRLLTELADGDYRVRELVTRVGEPQNLVSYHLRLLRDGGLVTVTRSSFDGRDSYYHLDLDRCADGLADTGAALHPALHRQPTSLTPPVDLRRSPRVRVLFVCTGNSARSPIAEALLRHHTGEGAEAVSAGTHPKPCLHPNTIRVLHDEYGIDITGQHPRHLDPMTDRRFDYVISLCDKAREVCPDFRQHPRRAHWSITDPAVPGGTDQATYPAFQHTAADIDTRIRHLLPVLSAAL
jgi:protein-tyrosine-phosphatase/DNA-binding transcriptional ArsR family regulator